MNSRLIYIKESQDQLLLFKFILGLIFKVESDPISL